MFNHYSGCYGAMLLWFRTTRGRGISNPMAGCTAATLMKANGCVCERNSPFLVAICHLLLLSFSSHRGSCRLLLRGALFVTVPLLLPPLRLLHHVATASSRRGRAGWLAGDRARTNERTPKSSFFVPNSRTSSARFVLPLPSLCVSRCALHSGHTYCCRCSMVCLRV